MAFLENKQIIQIAAEVVIIVALFFYFNHKHKRLMNHIEDLAQRLEEQDEMIKKHEQIIKQLVEHINRISQIPPQNTYSQTPPRVIVPKPQNKNIKQSSAVSRSKRITEIDQKEHTEPPMQKPTPSNNKSSKVSFTNPKNSVRPYEQIEDIEEDDDDFDDDDEDLDEELAEELGDLEEISLKKQK